MQGASHTSHVITDQLTRALGEAVVRLWSNLAQDVQERVFQEAVACQGESIIPTLRLGDSRGIPESLVT